MGFHQNAYYFNGQKPQKQYDFPQPQNSKQMMYWSKHHSLHSWMNRLYAKKKGDQYIQTKIDISSSQNFCNSLFNSIDDFTSQSLLLTRQDISQLKSDIQNHRYEARSQDMHFVNQALDKISQGDFVFYSGDGY